LTRLKHLIPDGGLKHGMKQKEQSGYGLAAMLVAQAIVRALHLKGALSAADAKGIYAEAATLLKLEIAGREHSPEFDRAIELFEHLATTEPPERAERDGSVS